MRVTNKEVVVSVNIDLSQIEARMLERWLGGVSLDVMRKHLKETGATDKEADDIYNNIESLYYKLRDAREAGSL